MSKLCDLSQQWANYFPLYYNIRSYPYSNGRLLYNAAAEFVEKELNKIDKVFDDKACLLHKRFDLSTLYECNNVPKLSADTSVVITGNVGIDETVTTGSVTVYFNGADLYNHIYFDVPDTLESTYATVNRFDLTVSPTAITQEVENNVYFGFENSPRICVAVSGIYNNASMLLHERYIDVEGYYGNDFINLKKERLQLLWDGVYFTNNVWNYVTKITAYNLIGTVLNIKGGMFGFNDKPCGVVTTVYREVYPVGAEWDSDYGCMSIYKEIFNDAGEVIRDPLRLISFNDETDSTITGIVDFAIDPFSHNIYVLETGNKLHCYDFYEEVPGDSIKDAESDIVSPYNILFEINDYNKIEIKLQNKFIGNPFDDAFVLKVITPSNVTYILDGRGVATADTGEYLTFSEYPVRFIYELPEPGVYTFRCVYYDTETRTSKSHDMFFNYEIKTPVKTFNLGATYTGVDVSIDKYHVYLDTGSAIHVYRARSFAGVYDSINSKIYFHDIDPTVININNIDYVQTAVTGLVVHGDLNRLGDI